MNKAESNEIVLSMIGFAIVGAVAYWAYTKYVQPKVDSAVSTSKFFGIF